MRYDGEAPPIRHMPQVLGAASREVLREAGFSDAAITELAAAKAVHLGGE